MKNRCTNCATGGVIRRSAFVCGGCKFSAPAAPRHRGPGSSTTRTSARSDSTNVAIDDASSLAIKSSSTTAGSRNDNPRSLAAEIRRNLERDAEFLSMGSLKCASLFAGYQERARRILQLHEKVGTWSNLASMVELYYWLCKAQTGSPTPLEDDLLVGYSSLVLRWSRDQAGEERDSTARSTASSSSPPPGLSSDTIRTMGRALRACVLAHNKKRWEMAFTSAVQAETHSRHIFHNAARYVTQRKHGLALEDYSVLLPSFASRRAVENIYVEYGDLFEEVASALLSAARVSRARPDALQHWLPHILHAFGQMAIAMRGAMTFRGTRSGSMDGDAIAGCSATGEDEVACRRREKFRLLFTALVGRLKPHLAVLDYSHLCALALAVRQGGLYRDAGFWTQIAQIIRDRAREPGSFSIRSLGTLATALAETKSELEITPSIEENGGAYGGTPSCSVPALAAQGASTAGGCDPEEQETLRSLRELLDEILFEREAELCYHEITHLAENVPEDPGRRGLLCEKIAATVLLFPPTYLVSVFVAMQTWPESTTKGALAQDELCRDYANRGTRYNSSAEKLFRRVQSLLRRQLSMKTRYFTADDIARIVVHTSSSSKHDVAGPLHKSMQREVMRRLEEWAPAETQALVAKLRNIARCESWFVPQEYLPSNIRTC
ncbi:unnamed protein product [Amoebophrya sp. A120]|nr:unnamed protein product [Amoebophrya sp. A120]|eukprot:GSA120T00017545001.1